MIVVYKRHFLHFDVLNIITLIQVQSHVKDDCSMTMVICPYEEAGCAFHVSGFSKPQNVLARPRIDDNEPKYNNCVWKNNHK